MQRGVVVRRVGKLLNDLVSGVAHPLGQDFLLYVVVLAQQGPQSFVLLVVNGDRSYCRLAAGQSSAFDSQDLLLRLGRADFWGLGLVVVRGVECDAFLGDCRLRPLSHS